MKAKNIKLMIVSVMVQLVFCMTAADTNPNDSKPELDPIDFDAYGIRMRNVKAKFDKYFDGPNLDLVGAGSLLAYVRIGAPFNHRMNRNFIGGLTGKLTHCYSSYAKHMDSRSSQRCKEAMEEFDEMVGMAARYKDQYPDIVAALNEVNDDLFATNHHKFTREDIEQERVERKTYEEKYRLESEALLEKIRLEKERKNKGFWGYFK